MFWFLALLAIGALVVAALTSAPARVATPTERANDLPQELDGAPVDAETLARVGDPDTVADLVAEGRGDDLRGLGYRDEPPPDG